MTAPCWPPTGSTSASSSTGSPRSSTGELEAVPLAGEECALGAIGGAGDGRVVGGHRLIAAAEPAQQVRACGVEQVVAVETELAGQVKRGRGTLHLGHGDE